ncbi:DoxX family protein [Erythrobacter alti]|uniref:DoxX family protein n=1 Tax=Erythrobacter alti TaxID=1896145 RepID=UPI0030F43D57
MKMFATVVLILLALLSVAAGAAKLSQAPQEVEFFSALGLDPVWLYPLGILQVGGALACTLRRTRHAGLAAVTTGFAISSAMIFLSGNVAFGVASLIPVILALLLMRHYR